ncbi:aminotransferase [Caulobacter sp. S45]|uniref:aminotransferase n=1 Tax=Caulobacter sp. S45 TaxID=1641861 RepID=UPI001C2D0280|nr:aminotransferase [Caulobacter sp. S45]
MMNPLFAELPTTVFEEISALARQHGAVNLGQGFPDGNGPEDVRAQAAEALMHGSNQYPPMLGAPELRRAVVEHYARFQGLDLSLEEVLVTFGATEALACALFALIAPGDEVVLIQPMYDVYLPVVRQAGGIPRFLRLEPPHWRLDEAALEAAITPATRVLVLNNPLNPAARVFDIDELAAVARVCLRHDLIAVCDEVWEHVVFDGRRHRPLMALEGMRERTVKIGSAGKIFSMTGWKVGFACAAPPLQHVLAKVHQVLAFTVPPNLQAGVAYGLAKTEHYFAEVRGGFQRSRDRLAAALRQEGYAVLPSEGAYFLCVDLQASGVAVDDATFCRAAIMQAGVAAIPVSAFYAEAPVRNVVRLCFAKQDATLDEAARRLGAARRLFTP